MEKENQNVFIETLEWPLPVGINSSIFEHILKLENNADVLLLYLTMNAISFWWGGVWTVNSICDKTKMSKSRFRQAKKELEKLGIHVIATRSTN